MVTPGPAGPFVPAAPSGAPAGPGPVAPAVAIANKNVRKDFPEGEMFRNYAYQGLPVYTCHQDGRRSIPCRHMYLQRMMSLVCRSTSCGQRQRPS